jgi:hypothetical protein
VFRRRGTAWDCPRAPLAGEVLYVVGTPPINKGEPLALIGQR